MWEAIRANRRRSGLLVTFMATLLVATGAVAAGALAGPDAAWAGGLLALGIWGLLYAVAMLQGDNLALMAARARQLSKEDAPQLWNITEEMTIAAGLDAMPRLYLIDDDAPNAFATASRRGPAAVAVTAGLLRRLDRDELQGVIAHEIGHIRNRDVQFMTLALVMVGSIALIADMALRIMWYGGGRRRSSKGDGQAQMVLMLLTLVAAILAPLFARMLYFAVSRQREYLADASAARFTRYPPGLASALEKIAGSQHPSRGREMRAMAPLYIVNPLARAAGGLFSSHPPLAKRVAVLRAMAGGAGYADYEKAFRQVVGARTPCLDRQTLSAEGPVSSRSASPADDSRKQAMDRAREVTDLLDRLADFLLVACACGVQIKVPPDYPGRQVNCPRCRRQHSVPEATVAAAAAVSTAARAAAARQDRDPAARAATDPGEAIFTRQSRDWESFRCPCGRVLQLSPSFSASHVRCKGCRRKVRIQPAATERRS